MSTTTSPVADTLAATKRVHKAMRRILADLDYGLSANAVWVAPDSVVIVASSVFAMRRWEAQYPERTVTIDGHPVSLHIAVEGDVEGGRS